MTRYVYKLIRAVLTNVECVKAGVAFGTLHTNTHAIDYTKIKGDGMLWSLWEEK